MVRNHQTAPLGAQNVQVVETVIQYPYTAYHREEQAETGRNSAACQAATLGAVTLENQQQVKPHQRQRQPAEAEQGEAQSGHQHAPYPIEAGT